jgi:hypothetical protein
VNGKTTAASEEPSPPDAGIGVVGKSSPLSLPLPSTIATTRIAKEKKGGGERPLREDQENGDDAPSSDAVVSRKSDGGKKEKEKGEKPNSLFEDEGRKAMEKVTAIATATTTTKATSGGVEEGSKDVGSFGGKKKTAANDDIPLDVAGESPPSSSTTAE